MHDFFRVLNKFSIYLINIQVFSRDFEMIPPFFFLKKKKISFQFQLIKANYRFTAVVNHLQRIVEYQRKRILFSYYTLAREMNIWNVQAVAKRNNNNND